MENVMLAVKFVLFYGLEAIVVAIVAVVLFAVLYEFFKEQVQILRRGPFPKTRDPFPQITRDWKNR